MAAWSSDAAVTITFSRLRRALRHLHAPGHDPWHQADYDPDDQSDESNQPDAQLKPETLRSNLAPASFDIAATVTTWPGARQAACAVKKRPTPEGADRRQEAGRSASTATTFLTPSLLRLPTALGGDRRSARVGYEDVCQFPRHLAHNLLVDISTVRRRPLPL